jgi:hypothetical protein
VDDARYNSRYSTTIERRGCTAETREMIHTDLQEWAKSAAGAKVYWMEGMAGTGKTTIMYTFCQWLEENKRLGASFCCSRHSSSCCKASVIIPTIAYQLAQYSPPFRDALCSILEHDADTGKRDIGTQFRELLRGPMQKLREPISEGAVVAIDALDECDNNSEVQLFLNTLLTFASDLPIKFFVTSRPEHIIRAKMGGNMISILHLHDIEQSVVEEDIKKYLKDELCAMSPPLSPDEIASLAKLAGKLFIYATTAARYIHPKTMRVDSRTRLRAFLKTELVSGDMLVSTKQYQKLDGLYATILAAAFNLELEAKELEAMELVLRMAVCAREPMTTDTLGSFLNLTKENVEIALEPLRSVLHVPEDGGLVAPLHASFAEYLLDSSRSGNFYCDRAQQSEIIARRCFDVMKRQLRFNICDLDSSFVFDKDVDGLEKRIKENVSPALSYSSRHWGAHLGEVTNRDNILRSELLDFLGHRLLFWMEVLNLEQQMKPGAEILRWAQRWLTLTYVSDQIHRGGHGN